jgi:hypothetical protein
MLDGKRYFAEFPDEDPARRAFLHSPKVIATLRALEKELRPWLPLGFDQHTMPLGENEPCHCRRVSSPV